MNPYNFGSPWERPRFSPAPAAAGRISYGQPPNQSPSGGGGYYGPPCVSSPSAHNVSPYSRPPPPRPPYSPAQRYSPYGQTSTPNSSQLSTPSSSFNSSRGSAAANSTPYHNSRFNLDRGGFSRGSGRGRGFTSPHSNSGPRHRTFCSSAAGGSGDISEYYHPAMLQDPWAKLQPVSAVHSTSVTPG